MKIKNAITAARCEAKPGAQGSELYLYGDIGADWFGEGITAKAFGAELAKCTGPVSVFINSPGGNVWEGLAIYSLMKRHGEPVTCYVDGLAASIASVIALGGSKLVVTEASMLMVHNAMAVAYGNAAEFRKMADDLEKISGTIAGIYVAKTGMKLAAVTEMMDAETWLSAEDCVEKGFADEMKAPAAEPDEDEPAPAPVAVLDTYRNTPPALRAEPADLAVARMRVALLKNALRRSPSAAGNRSPSAAGPQDPATQRGQTT